MHAHDADEPPVDTHRSRKIDKSGRLRAGRALQQAAKQQRLLHVANEWAFQALLKPGSGGHALPHQQSSCRGHHLALGVGHAHPCGVLLARLRAHQHVLYLGAAKPFAPHHFSVGKNTRLNGTFVQTIGQGSGRIASDQLQGASGLALGIALNPFTKPQGHENDRGCDKRTKQQRNLRAKAVFGEHGEVHSASRVLCPFNASAEHCTQRTPNRRSRLTVHGPPWHYHRRSRAFARTGEKHAMGRQQRIRQR